MIWQNPIAWFGLLTIALPILVHLFSRRQTRVLSFPSLRFLDVSRLLPTRRTQITDTLLLALRVAILLAATAALVQPRFSRRVASTSTPVTAIVVDTLATRGDSVARAAVEDSLRSLSANGSTLRIHTDNVSQALRGAAAWLATQHGQRKLVVVSDFRRNADSADFAAVSKDVSVRLISVVSPARDSSAENGANIWWAPAINPSAQTLDARNAARESARTLGATAIVDALSNTARTVVVASPSSDSLAAWTAAAQAPNAAWMGDALVRLGADTTLITAARQSNVTDTVVTAPFVTLARAANGAPLVLAASLKHAAASRLLIITRSPDDALVTAALLLAASHAVEAAHIASNNAAAPDRARLTAWEHAPAATALVPASAPSDFSNGPSDARWLWIVVLLLLGAETLMRTRMAARSAAQQGIAESAVIS